MLTSVIDGQETSGGTEYVSRNPAVLDDVVARVGLAAIERPFSLLSFEDEWRVAYAEDFQSAHYYDTPAALERAARLMSSLHHVALDQTRSRRRISDIRKELASS